MHAFWTFSRKLLQHRLMLCAAIVFAVLSAGGLASGLVSIGPMIKLILSGQDGTTLKDLAIQFNQDGYWISIPGWLINQLPTDPFQGIVFLMAVVGCLTILGATANFLHQFFAMSVCARTIGRIRTQVFTHVISLPLENVLRRGPAEFISRVNRDSLELQKGFLALTSKALAQVTKGLAAMAAALWFDWRLVIVALVIAPLMAVILRKFGKRIRRGTHGMLSAQEDLLRISNETVQGLRAVKSSSAQAHAIDRFDQVNNEVVRQELKVRTARAIASPLVEAIAVIVILLLSIIASREILQGNMAIDDFIMAVGSLGIAGGAFKPLTGLLNDIQAADAPADRLESILSLPGESASAGTDQLAPLSGSIRFEGIRMSYPGASVPALDGIDLEITAGRRVVIVGPNGCGKTTLLSLLPRLLNPDEGVISFDGVDISSVTLDSLRRQIGVVTQETILFNESIRNNILFGRSGMSDQAVIDAARQAHALDFIERLPRGLDTQVHEQGTSLSGGQRQRVAIARAILADPRVLILDEATSQIDAESEQQINEAIAEFCNGRTAIVIAHRLSTVLAADQIVVMDLGRIVDHGSHEQLMDRCEVYRRIVQTQLVPEPA